MTSVSGGQIILTPTQLGKTIWGDSMERVVVKQQ